MTDDSGIVGEWTEREHVPVPSQVTDDADPQARRVAGGGPRERGQRLRGGV